MNERLEAIKSSILDSLDKAKTALNNKDVKVESLKVSEIPGYIRQIELNKIKLTVTCSEFESGTIKATKDGKERVGTVQDGQCIIMLPSTGTWHIEHDLGDYVETEVNGETSVELVKKKVTFSEGDCSEEKITVHVDSVTGNNSNDNFIRVKKNGVVIEVQAQLVGSDIEITNFEYEDEAIYTIEYVIKDEVRGSIEIKITVIPNNLVGSSENLYEGLEGVTKKSDDWLGTSYSGVPKNLVFTNQKAPQDVQLSYWTANGKNGIVRWIDRDVDTLYISTQDSNKKVILPENCSKFFYGGASMPTIFKSIDLENIDSSNVTNMSFMFAYANGIKNLDKLKTDKVTDMSFMFYNYGGSDLDLSSFVTNNVTNMDGMFYSSKITNLKLKSFNTDNVQKMSDMFRLCKSLTTLDLSSFKTEQVSTMERMFNDCTSLQELDISNFTVGSNTNCNLMFNGDSLLEKIYAKEWEKNSIRDNYSMFSGCKLLPNYNYSNTDSTMAKWKENGGYFTNPAEKG